MIICDFSTTMRACVAAEIGFNKQITVDEGMIRHMILNSVRSNLVKFRPDYGELVLAIDGRDYWRRESFPYYKARRRKEQKESPLDWATIFKSLDKVKDELAENFPYRVVEVAKAEADDIVGVLAKRSQEKVLILSRDRDFIQLQDTFSDKVKQWDPIGKKFVTAADPDRELLEKIIKGDSGDGVPNVMSPDDTFVLGKRQQPITAKRLEKFSAELPKGVGEPDHVKNYERNKRMVDLSQTPDQVATDIWSKYESEAGKTKKDLLSYFMANRLRNLTQSISDF